MWLNCNFFIFFSSLSSFIVILFTCKCFFVKLQHVIKTLYHCRSDMRAISNDKANNIYSLLRSKKSNSKIAKQVGVSRTTVQKYRSSLKMSGNVDEGGRPSLISQRMVNYIRRLVTLGRKNNAVEIQKALKEEFGMSVSDSTVRRVLKKAGFIAFVKPQKPLLRSQNIVKRLQWAKSH